jgi:hypothetical protein
MTEWLFYLFKDASVNIQVAEGAHKEVEIQAVGEVARLTQHCHNHVF